jgi:hypothetical protein
LCQQKETCCGGCRGGWVVISSAHFISPGH